MLTRSSCQPLCSLKTRSYEFSYAKAYREFKWNGFESGAEDGGAGVLAVLDSPFFDLSVCSVASHLFHFANYPHPLSLHLASSSISWEEILLSPCAS